MSQLCTKCGRMKRQFYRIEGNIVCVKCQTGFKDSERVRFTFETADMSRLGHTLLKAAQGVRIERMRKSNEARKEEYKDPVYRAAIIEKQRARKTI